MPYTPFETAQISKTYLEKLGYRISDSPARR